MLTVVAALTLGAAIDAPVTQVTVYSDRARVVRTASVSLNGTAKVELPLLIETVDASSIRVEAQGAEVRRVDIAFVDAQDVPVDEARALLTRLEQLDDQIALASAQREAHQAQLDSLQRVTPAVPPQDPLKPPPKMQPAGWPGALAFVDEASARLHEKVNELDARLEGLARDREAAAQQAALLGGAERRAGYQVTVMLSGTGTARLTATYMVERARWYPSYDIQYLPREGQVQISFAGLVSQETGEDWNDAALTLSTAVPSTVTVMPRLLTWKIGDRDRFIPTPAARSEPPPPPPPPYPPLPALELRPEQLRQRLLAVAGRPVPLKDGKSRAPRPEATVDFEEEMISGELAAPEPPMPPPPMAPSMPSSAPSMPPPPPPPPPRRAAPSKQRARAPEEVMIVSGGPAAQPMSGVGLGAPPGYVAPAFNPDLPAAAAGGYDLSYQSARVETVGSGKGARRVALFAQKWPVTVERKVFAALAPEAFLVAEIKNPSDRPLPGGNANLFVGEDPAGTARLDLVSSGEQFTLPLGLDRAIRPIRNVKVVQTETGFIIGKEEITEYVVTIELANPYPSPIPVTVIDQVPVTDDKDLEVKLLKTSPAPSSQDAVKGQLDWKITLPAGGKSVVSFSYTLKRPKGYRLRQ
jgi:hypothetical protein